MLERITFQIFRACLLACAATVLIIIWAGNAIHNPIVFQIAATLFVIGLASFLLWFSSTLRKFVSSTK